MSDALEAFEKSWQVTPEKIDEAVRRIVAHADPLKIILFGSRARGDHRPDSDVDLAVILEGPQARGYERSLHGVLAGLRMELTLIAAEKEKYDTHRPWLNSVFHAIDQEGIVLYERKVQECPCADFVGTVARG